VSHRAIALHSLHTEDQHQIMAVGSYVSPDSPPPFAAQFVTITLDTETGQLAVDEMVMAVDSGVIINPITASGQIEGGMVQAWDTCEKWCLTVTDGCSTRASAQQNLPGGEIPRWA
jgi:putative selenate reductase molybdopterin-binding subunit